MWSLLRRNPFAAFLAVLMHVAIIAFLVVGVDWRKQPVPVTSNVEVVRAHVVDEAKLAQQVDQLKEQQAKRQAQADARRERETKQLAELQRRRAEQKAQLAEIERQRQLAEQRLKEQKAQEQAEQARRAKAEAKRKAQAEARRKAELEAQRKAQAEARRKAEQEAKRKAAAEHERQVKLARQRELEAQLQADRDQSEIGQVVAAIQQKVERNWLRPPGTADRGLACRVRVRLGSNGSVLLVQVIESSGNGAFDRSVESAVRKAEPLPMPAADRLKSHFRELTFEFNPGG